MIFCFDPQLLSCWHRDLLRLWLKTNTSSSTQKRDCSPGVTEVMVQLFPDMFVYFFLSETALFCFISDPAKRMHGAYGYIGYLGVIILSVSVALQLLGIY